MFFSFMALMLRHVAFVPSKKQLPQCRPSGLAPKIMKFQAWRTLLMTLVYAFICKPCVYIITYLAAPSQPPGNIEWNLTNSKIFLNWEHVKAMENESEVTGYKVSLSE